MTALQDWPAYRAALARLLGELGLSPHELPHFEPGGPDPVGAAVALCGARAHLTTISKAIEWEPRIPLLATRSNGVPVLLLPRPHGWSYVPVSGKRRRARRLTSRELALLDPTGWAVRRRLPHQGKTGRGLLRFAMSGAGGAVAGTSSGGMLSALLTFLTPIGSLSLIAAVLTGHTSLVLPICGGMLAAVPLAWAAGRLRDRAAAMLQTRLQATLEPAIWDRLLSLPLSFFRSYPLRSLLGYAGGVGRLRSLLGTAGLDSVLSAVFSGIAVSLLAVVDWRLGLAAVSIVALLLLVVGVLAWCQQTHDAEVYDAVESVQATLYPALLGIDEIHAYGAQQVVFDRWWKAFDRQKRADDHGLRYAEFSAALISAALPILLVTLLMLSQYIGAGLTGAWAAAFGSIQLNLALAKLPSVLQAVFSVRVTHAQLRPILDAVPENTPERRPPGELRGNLALHGVTFGYPGTTMPVLDRVDLTVRKGEFVAVVGESGAGKSTLLRLLLGLDTPTAGSVLLDGYDLAGLDLDVVRAQIGYVPQDGSVLRGDVRNAILGSTLERDDETAWRAAALAGLEDELRALPMGLETRLTDGTAGLSGGQLQRLLLARALAKRPRALLLDEATSALDNSTQDEVSDAVAELGLTRVVVAHRLSTIRRADRIAVLSAGALVETGTFEELSAAGGPFARLMVHTPRPREGEATQQWAR